MADNILDLDRELDRLCEMLRNTRDEQMRAKLVEAIREIIDRIGAGPRDDMPSGSNRPR